MRAKAIIERATTKTRIPTIRKKSAPQATKGYLKKPELVKIIDSVKTGVGLVGSTSNDENRPPVKSKLISGIVAKNVQFTPHKTRTGRVYCRLSNVFAHKLSRRSQLLPATPLSNKCTNEPEIAKPLEEPTFENATPQTTLHVVSDTAAAASIKPPEIVNFVSEEDIEKVPNLEDIPQPVALISFNSTLNESIIDAKDGGVDETYKSMVENAETNTTEEPVNTEVVGPVTEKKEAESGGTSVQNGGEIIEEVESAAIDEEAEKSGVENVDEVENIGAELDNQLIVDEATTSKTLPKLPEIIDYVASPSVNRKSVTLSPESSPLIPRMNSLKIFQQFKGFAPLVFEPLSTSASKELISSTSQEVVVIIPEELGKEKLVVEEKQNELEKENVVEEITPVKESSELNISPKQQLPELPEVICEKPTEPPGLSNTDLELFYPCSNTTDNKKDNNRRKSRRFNVDEMNGRNPDPANTFNSSMSPHITRRKPKRNNKDTVLNNEPAENKSNPRCRRNSIFPRQAIKTIKEKDGFDAGNDTTVKDLYQPSSSSPPQSLDDSVICLSPVPSSSSSNVPSVEEEENHTTESVSELPAQYEPPLKKNRGRQRKISGNKQSPNKKLASSPQKSDAAVGDEGETQQTSNGLETVDGKVFALLNKKPYRKNIPLRIEVDASLLVEPKESCLKKPKNQTWNGEKRFRWADWTKDKELADILEFESDEKYSLRKSTKNKRFKDPYEDE